MGKFFEGVLKKRVLLVVVFILFAVISLPMTALVEVNGSLTDYLPKSAKSTVALDVMEASYDDAVPNMRVMIPDVSIVEALEYKDRIRQVEGVTDVAWLDDVASIQVPLETQDKKTVEEYYKDGNALLSVTVDSKNLVAATTAVRGIIGDSGAISGGEIDNLGEEIARIMMFVIPIAILILLITTTSWVEPFLLFINLGVAILINMGTNLFKGEVSSVTFICAAVLQLACSVDYGIFLLDRFAEIRKEGITPFEAMQKAVTSSLSSILSSGLTTVVGFAALIAMQFLIGPDMGIVLSKGIIISLLSTLIFLPCLTLLCYKFIDKTTHRSFMPSFKGTAKVISKIFRPVAVVIVLLIVPCYLASVNIPFTYGVGDVTEGDTQAAIDARKINEVFGTSESFALMVPKGNMGTEMELVAAVKSMPEVSSVLSYSESVGNSIPPEFLPEDVREQLLSSEYSRLVISARVPPESAQTFAFIQALRDTAQQYFPGRYHLAGEAVSVYDMKETITADSIKVNLISIGGIALLILLAFKSLSLPIILLLTIQTSIYINMAVPYFSGSPIDYIGYLVISSVQLGATVDYAILFANRYIENRRRMDKRRAQRETIMNTTGSILTSGSILTMAGLFLGYMSTDRLISQLGILLARGAALSTALVLVFLPALLYIFDGLIQKTTWGANFQTPLRIAKKTEQDTDDGKAV